MGTCKVMTLFGGCGLWVAWLDVHGVVVLVEREGCRVIACWVFQLEAVLLFRGLCVGRSRLWWLRLVLNPAGGARCDDVPDARVEALCDTLYHQMSARRDDGVDARGSRALCRGVSNGRELRGEGGASCHSLVASLFKPLDDEGIVVLDLCLGDVHVLDGPGHACCMFAEAAVDIRDNGGKVSGQFLMIFVVACRRGGIVSDLCEVCGSGEVALKLAKPCL